MIIQITKLQYIALNHLHRKIDEMAKAAGTTPDVIEDWEKNSIDYLSARNYFQALQIAQMNGQSSKAILEDIQKNIEILED